MDTDKAYILGLVIGGGIWGNEEDVFRIKLSFRQWGSYAKHPERASEISRDVMKMVSPLFRGIYNISVSYDTDVSGEWNILCEGDVASLKKDLQKYGIICEGEIKKFVNITKIIEELVDDNLKRRFIAGLADTIGSTKESHRRFNDNKQMVSFEISGFNFQFVCSLCKLLHSIKCYPDQILWNHPNFHSGHNPYNKKWKKGFKLRVSLDQYEKFGAFAFSSKVLSARENISMETERNEANPCSDRKIKQPSISCVHRDENSTLLPYPIRGGHYLHNRHICAVMNCEHAPYQQISKLIDNAEYLISPFPILITGTKNDISNIIENDILLKNRNYKKLNIKISQICNYKKKLIFSENDESGYPINKVVLSIAFLLAAQTGQLNGNRPKGHANEIITTHLKNHPNATVTIYIPDILTPIILELNNYSALVGPNNPQLYKKLIKTSNENPYKIEVHNINENDFTKEK